MPDRTFGELFVESHGEPIQFEGKTAHGAYELDTSAPMALQVRFRRTTSAVRQALRLAVQHGRLGVNSQSLQDVVLWVDTAPRTVRVDVRPTRKDCRVTIWNAWEDRGMQAWIGNGGMLVEPVPGGVLLRCSTG